MKKNNSNTILYIFALILLCIIVLFPLMKPGLIVTDDGDWMVIRLTSFYQSFADGQFPVRFLMRLNQNYGYPIANFLYPGYLYIGTLLRLMKFPYVAIIEFILGGSLVISVVCGFLWLKRIFSDIGSFIGAATIGVSPYFLFDLYKRGSVGEMLATASLMVLLTCIESGFLWLISPIMTLLLLSHNTLALLYTLFIVGYIIVRKKWQVIVPVLIGTVMSLFFWLPAFFERNFVRFDQVQVSNPFNYFTLSQNLLYMGLPYILSLLFIFFVKKKGISKGNWFMSLVFILSASLATTLSWILWKQELLVRFIQFPFRTLSLVSITGSYFIASLIDSLNKKWVLIIGTLTIGFFIMVNSPLLWNVQNIIHDEGYYTTNEGTTTVGDEYMPKWAQDKSQIRANEKLVLYSGRGTLKTLYMSTKRLDASLEFSEYSVIEFNTIFYPGWGAILDGKPVEISYQNPRGIMRVNVPKGSHLISFEFRETAFRYFADVCTSFGVMLYGFYIIYILTNKIRRKPRL